MARPRAIRANDDNNETEAYMPLMTQLNDTRGRARRMPWAWEDRCIIVRHIIGEGGHDELKRTGKWTFKTPLAYCQVDTRHVVRIKAGQSYEEWRS